MNSDICCKNIINAFKGDSKLPTDKELKGLLALIKVFKETYQFIDPQDKNTEKLPSFVTCEDFIESL